MKTFLKKNKYFITVVLMLGLIIIFFIIKNDLKSNSDDVVAIENKQNLEIVDNKENTEVSMFVDIKGAINNPGVYEVKDNNRVIDVINMAGGLISDANTSLINLSKKIIDEMVIIIYTNEEVLSSNKTSTITVFKEIEKECVCPNIKNDGCINTEIDNKNNNISQENNSSEPDIVNEKININHATIEELQSLDGIGESKANAIIKYREENGNFNTNEDIMNVSGIGQSVYDKIKENITI